MNKNLEIKCKNASELAQTNQAAFAMMRRDGLGASDTAVYLGLNKWKTVDQLIEEKVSIGLTDSELEVANKEVVRKGRDLEPLILTKFTEWCGMETEKPEAMYQFREHPRLTVNFDGIMDLAGTLIPVEAKYVSPYANKYWDRSHCLDHIAGGKPFLCGGSSVAEHCTLSGQGYGIPDYYYPQIQQQMLALDAPFGYFAVLFDRGWELGVYKIYADKFVQDAIIKESEIVWNRILEKRETP